MVFLASTGISFSQQSEPELKATAEKLFEEEKYTEAKTYVERLLALNPRSADYQYKYGTCLLYSGYKKQDAFKYLQYSVTDPTIDVAAFYFLGKAYHLTYQFNEAIKNYELYKQKSGGKPNPKFDVDRQIETCQNGKRLLSTLTEIIVLDKKEISASEFFRIYDLRNIGGEVIVAANFQSKIDKKKNYVPLIHFPPKAAVVYYASYGESDNGHKDIYSRKKLPDGSWGLPQLVGGDVNTSYDEEYPYMHPGGEYLYFSSKGHNSMGGFDVFRCKLDPETGKFGTAENIDFAISSTDNDLFYVVDSLDQNAYFASARQSNNGKIHVYKVRVDRVPLQIAVIKGDFASTIKAENKKLSIVVTDYASGDKIGTFNTDSKGKYLITLPKSGKYLYEMKVDGSSVSHKYLMTVPYSKEFKPLKQHIQEELLESAEVVKVTDLFNESFDDPLAILAEVIQLRSELNVNVQNFNLEELDKPETNEVLVDLGLKNATPQEIQEKLDQLVEKQDNAADGTQKLVDGAKVQAAEALKDADVLQKQAKALVAQSSDATDKEKYDLLKDAKEKMDKADDLKAEASMLIHFSDSLLPKAVEERKDADALKALSAAINTSIQTDKTDSIPKLVEKNGDLVKEVNSTNASNPIDPVLAEKKGIVDAGNKLNVTADSYRTSLKEKTAEIGVLEKELEGAKPKDKPGIESKIATLKSDTAMLVQEIRILDKKIDGNKREEKAIDAQLTFLQNVNNVSTNNPPTADAVKQLQAEVDSKNTRSMDAYIDAELIKLEKQPEIASTSGDPQNSLQPEIDKGMAEVASLVDQSNTEETSIDSAPNLSGTEKAQLKIDNDTKTLKEIAEVKEQLTQEIAKNPTNEKAKGQLAEINALQEKTANNVAKNKKIIADSQGSTSAGITPEKELKTVYPSYATEKTAIKEPAPDKQLEALNALDQKLVDKVGAELDKVNEQLATDPANPTLIERKKALTDLKTQTEKNIGDRKAALDRMNGVSNDVAVTPESELKNLLPDYQSQQDGVPTTSRRKELEARNEIDEEALFAINGELTKVKEQVAANPSDPKLAAKAKALETLKADTKTKIANREKEIATLPEDTNPVAEVSTPEKELDNLVPDYKEKIAQVPTGDRKEELEGLKAIDTELINSAKDELGQVNESLATNPGDKGLESRKDALKTLITETSKRIFAYDEEIATLKQPEIVPETLASDKLKTEVRPDYQANLTKIDGSSMTEDQKEAARLKEEEALLTDVNEQILKNDKAIAKDPANEELIKKNDDLKELQAIQEAKLEEEKANSVAIEKAKIRPEILTQEIQPEYNLPTDQELSAKDETKQKGLAKQEQELREALVKRQNANEKKLKTAFDPKLVAENRVITELMTESVERENRIGEGPTETTPTAAETLVERLTPEQKEGFTEQPTTSAKAQEYIDQLSAVKEELDEEIENGNLSEEEKARKQEELTLVNNRIDVLLENKEELVKRENGNQVVDTNPDLNAQETRLTKLEQDEARIQEEMSGATPADKRKLDKELKAVTAERKAVEDSIATSEIAALQQERKEITSSIPESDPIATVLTQRGTSDPTETKVEQLQHEQEATTLAEAAKEGTDIVQQFNDNKLVVAQPEEIAKVKRRFYIEIGQIESEIERLGDSEADKAKKAELQRQRDILQTKIEELEQVEKVLQKDAVSNPVLAEGLQENVPFDKELEIRSNPQYPAALTAQQELNTVIAQRKDIEKQVAALRVRYAKEPENRNEIVSDLRALLEEQGNLADAQIAEEAKMKALFTEKGGDASAWQNVVSRELPIVKPKVDTAILAPFVAEGFKINQPNDNVKPVLNKDLPVGLKMPSGLVYRVQVGAFAKPVPEELFKEFTPVTGERLNNGITRYMAGFFGNRQRVLDAQKDIRALGYTDAFVVAYCDGERITLAEARRLEDLGLCVPRDQDEITMQVVQNVIAALPKDSLSTTPDKPSVSDYNKADGAAVAQAVEEKKGLFYTVQVGVYNKPVPGSQLKDISPLITKRLDNGQIRYSSGVFTSVGDALPKKKEAIARGITDAFITAYYNGERISLEEAKRILAEQGPSVLEKDEPIVVNEVAINKELNNAIENERKEEKGKAELVSKDTYISYPKSELQQLNSVGTFYYDSVSQRIKSATYSSSKALPAVGSSSTKFDTLYIGKVEEALITQSKRAEIFTDGEISGTLADWLLRGNIPFEAVADKETEALKIRIYASKTANFDVILNQLDMLGVSYKALNELENVE